MHDSDSNPCLSRKSGENVRVAQSGKVTETEDRKEMDSNNDRQRSTDEQQQPQAGLARRAVGGLFSLGAGVVGVGFGGVKWVASTSLSVAGGVVSKAGDVVSKVRGTGTDSSKDKKD